MADEPETTKPRLPVPTEIKIRMIELFLDGQSVNHITFLLDYKYNIDEVSAAIREAFAASRMRIPEPPVDTEVPEPMTLAQFRALVAKNCTICQADGLTEHPHDEPIIIHGRCHVSSSMWALFDPRFDLMVLVCQECGRQVARFRPT